MGRGYGWTDEEILILKTHLADKWTHSRIAKQRGWSLSSVKKKAAQITKERKAGVAEDKVGANRYSGRTQDPAVTEFF